MDLQSEPSADALHSPYFSSRKCDFPTDAEVMPTSADSNG